MTPNPNDPLRSLDGIGPPGRWDDVVARAEEPADEATAEATAGLDRRSHQPVLAAAAALAVVALVGGIILAVARDGDGDGRQGVTAVPGPTAGQGADPPAAIWGRTFSLIRLNVDASPSEVGQLADPAARLRFVLGTSDDQGIVEVSGLGCPHVAEPVAVEGATLVSGTIDLGSGDPPCETKDADLVLAVLLERPTIELGGDRLVLRTGTSTLEAAEVSRSDAPPTDTPEAVWNRAWTVTRLVIDGGEEHPSGVGSASPTVLRFIREPTAEAGRIEVCQDAYSATVRGDRLHARALASVLSDPPCPAWPVTQALWKMSLGEVRIEVRGDRLVLRSKDRSIEAVDLSRPLGEATAGFFGHRWDVVRVVDGETVRTFPGAVLTAQTDPMAVSVSGCNGAGGPIHLDGDHLRADLPWAHTQKACVPPPGGDQPDLMAQDRWFEAFLRAEPTVAVTADGQTATLTTARAVVSLSRA